MLGYEPLELAHQLRATAELQLGVDSSFEREPPPLLEASRLGAHKRLVLEIRERTPAP